MTNVGFLILFGLSSVLFPCEGQVYPPSNQSTIVVLPGATERLKWSFVGDPAQASLAWYFTRRGGSEAEKLAVKFRTNAPIITKSSLPRLAIETPATLVLKNVDARYNGKYRLSVQQTGGGVDAEVDVFIAGKFS
ncbi:Hypothetical predicted protein [Paramuricea clavata]|uniref:Uncharacterized protein n=1 Tax=Paramuricea clavata TaxID=317549 RepID=A0A7D9HDG9_PARCT|nr:Hypothetical predicted protein [Paramuricea clavata]